MQHKYVKYLYYLIQIFHNLIIPQLPYFPDYNQWVIC